MAHHVQHQPASSAYTRRALHRVRIIRGQVEGLERSLAKSGYCVDILTQSLAIQESLKSLNAYILDHHLSTHVVEQIRSGKGAQAKAELLRIYKLSNKK
ncbi:MAG: metal-sensing transcriptional repressor [Patescibacteria group bacterium]